MSILGQLETLESLFNEALSIKKGVIAIILSLSSINGLEIDSSILNNYELCKIANG